MKVHKLKCFKQVASVLGDKQAKVELKAVIDSGIAFGDREDVIDCFDWSSSPQGRSFWCDVCLSAMRKVKP